MDDALNTAAALGVLSLFTNTLNKVMSAGSLLAEDREAATALLNDFERVLGIFGKLEEEILDDEIQKLIDERIAARRGRIMLAQMRYASNCIARDLA